MSPERIPKNFIVNAPEGRCTDCPAGRQGPPELKMSKNLEMPSLRSNKNINYIEISDEEDASCEEFFGSCTDQKILSECQQHASTACLYLLLLYLPDLKRWVIKTGYTDSGLTDRIKGLDTEYKINKSRFIDDVPRIIPLCIAKCSVPPKTVEKAFKKEIKDLIVPVVRGMITKKASGVDYAAFYDR